MAPTPFSTLVDLKRNNDRFQTTITDDWLQGRSSFGGLTASLCYSAVMKEYSDLPPLRSIQVSFIGPANGDVHFVTKLLRQGRNVTFIHAEMHAETGIAATCVFCFGTTRESQQSRNEINSLNVPMPDEVPSFFPEGQGPTFTQHLSQKLASGTTPFSGKDQADNALWVKMLDHANVDTITSLVSIGDALPPAEMSAFKVFAPISTMTWLMNFLTDRPATENGWWLVRAHAEHTEDGYSSQNMYGWNTKGEPIFTARQSIAVFA